MLTVFDPFTLFFLLLVGHCLADYPLQGDFLAQAKNRYTETGEKLWLWALPSHGIIHGGFVMLITGSFVLGLMETVAHCLIDWLKCENKISFGTDQWLHIACKVLWVGMLLIRGDAVAIIMLVR